jgi:hypothetical protein
MRTLPGGTATIGYEGALVGEGIDGDCEWKAAGAMTASAVTQKTMRRMVLLILTPHFN